MIKEKFEQFLQKKSAVQPDWSQIKMEWLDGLNQLYSLFVNALAEFKEKGELDYCFQDIELKEDFIGSYSAPKMIISLAGEIVELIPVGANIVAAKGRVDMRCNQRHIALVLINSNQIEPKVSAESMTEQSSLWEWKFLAGTHPRRKFFPVTQETILDMLMEVAEGE